MPPKTKYTVHSLKIENDSLKDNIKVMSREIQSMKDRIFRYEDRLKSTNLNPTDQDTQKTLEFVSDEFDDMKIFCSDTKKQISSLEARFAKLEESANNVAKTIEDNLRYSYQYNVKIVGLPQSRPRESARETTNLCLTLFNAIGALIQLCQQKNILKVYQALTT